MSEPVLTFSFVVRVAVVALSSVAILLCAWLALTDRDEIRSSRIVRVGFIDLPAVSLYKLVGLFGMFLLPLSAVTLSSYEVFEGNLATDACVRCHVMRPMLNDMSDPASELLAARHYRNRWIQEEHCYHCHADYGFAGTLEAKLTGLRHLLRYTSRTYHEPIQLRVPFNNANCLHCHAETPKYEAEDMHTLMADTIATNETSCTSCHGDAHPSREQRSPGNADYERLMRAPEEKP